MPICGRKGHFEVSQYHYRQYQRRRGKIRRGFWGKAEKLYYTALIGYIWYEAPEDEKNFTTLLEMINASEAREDDEDFQNPVDLMFERLEEKDPEHFAVKQYKNTNLRRARPQKAYLSHAARG